jgi:hypothetical protein
MHDNPLNGMCEPPVQSAVIIGRPRMLRGGLGFLHGGELDDPPFITRELRDETIRVGRRRMVATET